MKNFFYGFIATVIFSTFSFGQTQLDGPNYDADVKVKNQVYSAEYAGRVKILVITLGRESLHCHRWGICDVHSFGFDIYRAGQINVEVQDPTQNPFIIIQLTEELDSTKFDTNFYVEKDVELKDKSAKIIKGTYTLDTSIGSFGGYKVLVNLN